MLQLPTEDTVRLERCLPSSRFPSDHLPLFAHFAFGASPLSPASAPHPSRPPGLAAASKLPAALVASPSNSPSNSPPPPGRPAPVEKTASPLSAAATPFVIPTGAGLGSASSDLAAVLPPAYPTALPEHVAAPPRANPDSPKRPREGDAQPTPAEAAAGGGGTWDYARGVERGSGGGRGRGRGRRRRG